MTNVYPDGIPEIKVTRKDENDEMALSKDKLKELAQKLRSQAENLVGNEMCFDLIEVAREFIDKLAKKDKISFHSEMLLRQEERDKWVLDQQTIQLQKNEEILQMQRKAEMEELERKIRDELKEKYPPQSANENNDPKYSSNFCNLEYFSFESPLLVDGTEIKSVQSCSIAPKSWTFGQTVSVQSENEKFDLKIVSLTHPFLQTFGGRRQLEILLKNLKNHPLAVNENISRCFGGSINKESNQMLLLCERSSETYVAIENVLEQAGGLALHRVIDYLKQICSALVHLHSAGLTHRSLNLSSVVLDNKRNIKIVDYLVQKSLSDLAREHDISFENYVLESVESAWEAPEIVSKPNIHGKKVDIWSLGRLAIQMLLGRDILKWFPQGFKEFLHGNQCSNIPEIMKEFLAECLNVDSGKRLSAEDLLNCKLFKEAVGKDLLLFEVKRHHENPKKESNLIKSDRNQVNPSTSRYLNDFEELEFLGRGGFGSVVKVRNKIDDRFYAVKKIALDPRDVEYNKKILREVTTLSRLHHERIIRYYQAWIEEDSDVGDGEDSDDFDSSDTSNGPLDLSLGPKSFKPFSGLEEVEFSSCSSSNCSDFDDFIQFEGGNTTSDNSDSSDFEEDTSITSTSVKKQIVLNNPRAQVLYIQMEYCPNQTLRDLIDERSSDPTSHFLDPPEIWRLFRQIVEGLVHIHAQGMMHRDLKPSNIFLDSNGDVKIGDFGLAVTRIESAVMTTTTSMRPDSPFIIKAGDKSFTGESHTQNIGTPFYVSPEQLGSHASTARYNQKVDMYALGIILIELWVPFQTGMERIQSLQKCRLPDCILPSNSNLTLNENVIKISKRLLCHDPKMRFTSLELLRSDLLPPMLEEELIEDAMRGVAQPGAPHFPRLISTIFRRLGEMDSNQLRAKDFSFDVHSGNATELSVCEELGRIKREIERIFIRSGAVEVNPPLLYLPLTPGGTEEYSVLDDSGQRLELPANLTRPFARWVAQSSLNLNNLKMKRFAFDRVFRKISQVSGGQPYQPTEASFDLVHLDDERGTLELCEVVRVLFDSLMISGGKPEQFVFKFNHLKLRDRIVGAQKLTEYENYAGQGVQRLGPGVLDEKLVRLLTPLKADESAEMLLQRLSVYSNFSDLKSTLLKELAEALACLQKISIPLKVKVVFDPLFKGPRADLYSNDFCFVVLREAHGERPKRYGGGVNYETVACGGRYNQLVEEYKFPTARLEGKGPFAVGCSIFMDKLKHVVKRPLQKKMTNLVLNLLGDEPNSEELWLIGEMWRLGRSNFTVNPKNTMRVTQVPGILTVVLQMKATGRIIRVKSKSSVEEVALEDISTKLDEILSGDHFGDPIQSDLEQGSNNALISVDAESDIPASSFEGVHYVLQAKSEKNPFLREKAIKAVKSVNPGKSEIVIHELPRDILRKFLYDPGNNKLMGVGKPPVSEDYREQLAKLTNLLQTKLAGKAVILFNHKDQQIDMFYK